jgi:hypothetical protein
MVDKQAERTVGLMPGQVDLGERWVVSDAHLRRLAGDTYAFTYQLDQAGRLTRRVTLWRQDSEGWKILYHQGTIVQPTADAAS